MYLSSYRPIGVRYKVEIDVKKSVNIIVGSAESHHYGVSQRIIRSIGESALQVI